LFQVVRAQPLDFSSSFSSSAGNYESGDSAAAAKGTKRDSAAAGLA